LLHFAIGGSAPSSSACSQTPICGETFVAFPLVRGVSLGLWQAAGQPPFGTAFNASQAFVMVHGSDRNADQYLCWALLALDAAGRSISDTVVMAPFFADADDKVSDGIIFWDQNLGWKEGDNSSATLPLSLSSFAVMDAVVATLSDTALYPHMQRILIAGHSAGGQFVSRYAMFGASGLSPPELVFVSANPSSQPYLDASRPANIPLAGSCAPLSYCDNSTIPDFDYVFRVPLPPSVANCSGYDSWLYGLQALNSYTRNVTARVAVSLLHQRLKAGSLRVLLGAADVCNEKFCPDCDSHDIDSGCEASLMGNCRFQRGWAYYRHLQNFYRDTELPAPVTVPGVAHDACSMFTSSLGIRVLFG
jgi:pimeloyl-ACP methyl ester carboxylesterase